jgi:hypothetical protein
MDEIGETHCIRNIQKMLENMVGKPHLKRPIGILRREWDDNIKMDIELGCGLDLAA